MLTLKSVQKELDLYSDKVRKTNSRHQYGTDEIIIAFIVTIPSRVEPNKKIFLENFL